MFGGTTIGTILECGGMELVFSGTASGTTVSSGGEEVVAVFGYTIGTTVDSGGIEVVSSTAIGTTVDSGGEEVVSGGGTASATTINGGTVEVQGGGSIGSGITFTNAGGILQLDASQSFQGLIAGFASPSGVNEEIDLRDISFGKHMKLSFQEAQNNLSGTLTVTNGTQTATLELLGQYSAHNFSLASDAQGGTMITDPAAGTGGHPQLAPPA